MKTTKRYMLKGKYCCICSKKDKIIPSDVVDNDGDGWCNDCLEFFKNYGFKFKDETWNNKKS